MANKEEAYPQQVNLENCSKEPIHIIGMSQAHGLLLVCDPASLVIHQCGKNSSEVLYISHDELIGNSLSSFLTEQEVGKIKEFLEGDKKPATVNFEFAGDDFVLLLHLFGIHLIVDIEPLKKEHEKYGFENQFSGIHGQPERKRDITEICDAAARLTREIFQYDRVMIYNFDEEWNGEVIAEAKENELESGLGLRRINLFLQPG